MLDWIAKYWLEVVFSVVIGFFGWALKSIKKELKHYQELLDNEEKGAYVQVIDRKLQPIDTRVRDVERNVDYIIDSYRFRIITLCQLAIDKTYMSQNDFDQLTEMFKLYTSLNTKNNSDYSIVAEYFTKAKALPIKSYEEIERIRREKEHLEIQRIVKEEFEDFKQFLLENKKEGNSLL